MDGITDSMDMSLSKLTEIVKDRKPGVLQFMGSQRVRHESSTEQQLGSRSQERKRRGRGLPFFVIGCGVLKTITKSLTFFPRRAGIYFASP